MFLKQIVALFFLFSLSVQADVTGIAKIGEHTVVATDEQCLSKGPWQPEMDTSLLSRAYMLSRGSEGRVEGCGGIFELQTGQKVVVVRLEDGRTVMVDIRAFMAERRA